MIENLRKKYQTGILTNYNYEWMNELIDKFQLKKYFDSIVISSLKKVIKPDVRIYQMSLEEL
ncbi:MAG: HAD family hydrolase, partial [Methanobacterium sp.]